MLHLYANPTEEEREMTVREQLEHNYDANGRWWATDGNHTSTLCPNNRGHKHFGEKPLMDVSALWNEKYGPRPLEAHGHIDPQYKPVWYKVNTKEDAPNKANKAQVTNSDLEKQS